MPHSVIPGKIRIPTARTDTLFRRRLFEAMDSARDQGIPLVVMESPAGTGKTTAAADWLRRCGVPGAWLTLDRRDNDPCRFWGSVAAALDSAVPGDYGDDPMSIATALGGPLALVLDGYHHITDPAIHDGMNEMLDGIPDGVTVVVASRTRVPLELPRRRVCGRLCELGWAELAFTQPEVEELCNGVMSLGLNPGLAGSLHGRTEGWAAALGLAVRGINGVEDPQSFVESFSGGNRHLVDYIESEVLGTLPPDAVNFLLRTSVLDTLPPEACDRLVVETGSASMLRRLEGCGCFLLPVGGGPQRFRYQRTFAEAMGWMLSVTQGPGVVEDLYRKACEWHEERGLVEEAVRLAMRSPDKSLVVGLLDRHVLTLFFRTETTVIHGWLGSLGDETLRGHPLLSAVYANTLAHTASFNTRALSKTGRWLRDAEAGLQGLDGKIPEARAVLVRGFIALSHAYLALWGREAPQTVIGLAQKAISLLPPLGEGVVDEACMRLHSGLYCNLGMAYMNAGDAVRAGEALDKAWVIGVECGDMLNSYTSIAYKCYILRREGRLPEAADLCRQALASLPESPFSAAVHISLARIHLEWNDLAAAGEGIRTANRLNRLAGDSMVGLISDYTMARLLSARGDGPGARSVLERAMKRHPAAYEEIEAHRIRFQLSHDPEDREGLDAFYAWAGRHDFETVSPFRSLVLARVLIAQRQAVGPSVDLTRLSGFLERSIEEAENTDDIERLIELLILRAMLRRAEGDQPGALESLIRSLSLARRGGYVRMYLDEGMPMQTLVAAAISRYGRGAVGPGCEYAIEYATRLQPCFRSDRGTEPKSNPLFPRETEVLRLVASGASNAQVAQGLFISVNTVKRHLTNIFGKLGASSRSEAVETARELGLIP